MTPERISALGTIVHDLPEPRQSRSRETRDGLIEAGWQIVREQPWETISVTDIAKRAKRSVGAFYQRFGSKEDFLSVLFHRWIETRHDEQFFARPWRSPAELVDGYLDDTFTHIRDQRFLWRVALQRVIGHPESWEAFRALGAWRRDRLAERLGELRGRPLDEAERTRLALGLQVFNSVLNNSLLNNPGPLKVEDPDFLPVMQSVFRAVSEIDATA